jgi:hypothetical protein
MRSPFSAVRRSGSWQIDAGSVMIGRYEIVGARIRQWLEEHAFNDAEDGCIGADPYCERQHGHARKERHPREAPQELVQSHGKIYGYDRL